MELKKSFESMKQRIAGEVADRLTKVDLDSILGALGLQVVKRSKSMALPLLAAFGSGVAVGALFAPMTGKDLRTKVALLVGKLKARTGTKALDDGPREMTAEGDAIESPYDKAAKTESERAGSNGQKKNARLREPSVSDSTAT